jgi:tetratricopeptide (TPR) repeat protein
MLYQQGRYSEAENVAKEALTVAEKAFEPNHPYIGTSLNNLALLYYSQGKYALAESIFKQALVICETVFGKNNLHVGTLLDNMASN